MSSASPLVSVICLNHNQAPFLNEAIESVLSQDYTNIELILVDDGSTDASKQIIRQIIHKNTGIQYIDIPYASGNCKAFNKGLALAKGQYIIDLAADDVLEPHRISTQVKAFEELPEDYGIIYTDAYLIDHNSKKTGYSKPFKAFTGDIYQALIEFYFINPPTMMFKKGVLDELGGYNEKLNYEDFDFWIRSARYYKYCYIPEPLCRKRVLNTGLHRQFIQKNNKLLQSTFEVCKTIKNLNRNQEENAALIRRIQYEARQALLTNNYTLVKKYCALYRTITHAKRLNNYMQGMLWAAKWQLPLNRLYIAYAALREKLK